jgi:hypothetical protein
VQRSEQHVLFQTAGVRFDALQDPGMKGMEKIAVAEKKANYFCASLENATGLGVGTKSEAADRLKHSRARFRLT